MIHLSNGIGGTTNSHPINDVRAIMSFYNIPERVVSNAMNTIAYFFLSNKREEQSSKTKSFIYILHEFYISQNKFSGIRSIYTRGSLGNFFIRKHAYILDTHARTHARNDVLAKLVPRNDIRQLYVRCDILIFLTTLVGRIF